MRSRESRRFWTMGLWTSVGIAAIASLVPVLPDAIDPRTYVVRAGVLWQLAFLIKSHVDIAANVLLGTPIGFFGLGTLALSGHAPIAPRIGALVVLAAAAGLALVLETAQIFLPERVASGLDVAALTTGAAIGIAAWLVASIWRSWSVRWDC